MNLPRSAATPLHHLLVAEVGERIAVGACGSLLAQLGAEVALVEPRQSRATHKWRSRALVAAGKRSLTVEADSAADAERLNQLLHSADIVLLSGDVTITPEREWRHDQIVCDITAFGDSGPLSGLAYSDAMVQAVSGILDTTGNPAAPPAPVGFPILEFCAGIYAAAAVIVALRVRRLPRAQGRPSPADAARWVPSLTPPVPAAHHRGRVGPGRLRPPAPLGETTEKGLYVSYALEAPPALAQRVYKGASASLGEGVVEFDISKIRTQLGYRDIVAPAQALAASVDWLLANRPQPGDEIERQLGDPFAYAAEDALIAACKSGNGAAESVQFPDMQLGHMYRHPKKPGEAWAPPAR
jgi:CoA-transferase family III